jgi:hypothetical protein
VLAKHEVVGSKPITRSIQDPSDNDKCGPFFRKPTTFIVHEEDETRSKDPVDRSGARVSGLVSRILMACYTLVWVTGGGGITTS